MATCAACGTSNPPEARFCGACGAALAAPCAACGAPLAPDARFCSSCGTPVAAEAGGEERKLVTILFADVTGSTTLGERLDPERMRDVLATYFAAMREEIEAQGGTVEKFIGDAVMAAFGVPAAHEDDPERALRAARRMLARLAAVNDELSARHGIALQIRIGVNTGEALATRDPRPGEAMVTGDVVNTAARLEAAAEPGEVLVGERTARAVRGFRFGDARELALKGKAEHVRARVLAGEDPTAGRGVAGLHAPMVGRDRELDLLDSILRRVSDERRPHLVTIYGDAGVGKSRLTKELVGAVAAGGGAAAILSGRCLPYGDGVTYWPLAEILKEHGGVRDSDPADVALDKIDAVCANLGPSVDAERVRAALAHTLGLDDPRRPLREVEPRQVRIEVRVAWRAFFSSLASAGPVLAVIEDIHWADVEMLELLEDLAERVEGPVLFVCPSRPELVDRHPTWGGGRRNVSSLSLEPLGRDEADRLVGLLLAVEDLPQPVHDRILERAEGNPFFLEEIVRRLIDEGALLREGDRWRAAAAIDEVEIPDTVQGVLAARIDLLDPGDKRALQLAAVVGRVFWPGSVRAMLNGDAAALDDAFGRLEARELVVSRVGSAITDEQEYIFKHVLTRDVAYESLPRRDRARAHDAVAAWIESTAGDRSREFGELLAYHLEEAYRSTRDDPSSGPEDTERLRRRAFATLMETADGSRRRGAIEKALSLAERAARLADGPIERIDALELRGLTGLNDYRGDLAWETLRSAVDLRLEHAPEDRSAIARACARAIESPTRWPGSMRRVAPEDEVRRYLEIGFEHAGSEDSEEHVRLLTAAAFLPFSFGELPDQAAGERAREHGREGAEMALRIGRPDLASGALDATNSVGVSQGLYARDLDVIEARLDLLDRIDDAWERGDILAMATWVWASIGEPARARGYGERGIAEGNEWTEGMRLHSASWLALVEFQLGNWDRIPELLRLGSAWLADRVTNPPYFTVHLFGAASLVLHAGRSPEAERAAEGLAAIGMDDEGSHGRIAVMCWLAWLALRDGDLERAGELVERARASVRGHLAQHRPFVDQVVATYLGDAGRWDQVPAFLQDSGAYAERAGLRALPLHLERLAARAAATEGRLDDARAGFERADEGFAALEMPWEGAVTRLQHAEALAVAGATDDAAAAAATTVEEFERLKSLDELRRARALAGAEG